MSEESIWTPFSQSREVRRISILASGWFCLNVLDHRRENSHGFAHKAGMEKVLVGHGGMICMRPSVDLVPEVLMLNSF